MSVLLLTESLFYGITTLIWLCIAAWSFSGAAKGIAQSLHTESDPEVKAEKRKSETREAQLILGEPSRRFSSSLFSF